MTAPRALLAALLLLPLACAEGDATGKTAPADASLPAADDASDPSAAAATPAAEAPPAPVADADLAPADDGAPDGVTVRTLSAEEFLGGGAPEPALPDDGTGLPDLGRLPEFSLVADSGKPFTRADMLGDVWVVDFIFTRCAGICVPMAQTYVELQEQELPARFLSVTVDPQNDAPQVLADYRAKWGGKQDRWTLLTGARDEIQRLGDEGFKLPVNATGTTTQGMAPLFHSGKFALVDHLGRVRGFYDYRDELELERLREDAAALRGLLPG